MQTVFASLPKFKHIGDNAIAAPVGGTRARLVNVPCNACATGVF